MKKYVHLLEREYRPYDEFRSISDYALTRASKEEIGRPFECVVSIIFDAFCLEAYLNHLGLIKLSPSEFKNYEKQSPKEKLNQISKVVSLSINIKQLPFCHFGIIFRFRDEIAHAKTDHTGPQSVVIDSKTSIPQFPPTILEGLPTLENTRKFLKSTTEMVNQLNDAAGIPDPAFGHPYDAFWVG
jgi:hypothetical protein